MVKGKTDPVRAWVAVRPLVAAGERAFSEVPLVGRGEELATLRSTWDLVSSEHRPTLVTMFGPAGIGKSRLAHELAHLVEASGGLALRGRSAGYGDSGPYSAFAQHVAQLSGVYDSDEPDDALAKLRARAAELEVSEDPDEVAEHLAILSGLPVEGSVADRETLFFSARLFLEAVARERPTLLAFEDLHFADQSLHGSGRVPRLARPGRAAAARGDRPPGAAHRATDVGRGIARVERRVVRRRSTSTTRSNSPTGSSPSAGSRPSPTGPVRSRPRATATRCSSRS